MRTDKEINVQELYSEIENIYTKIKEIISIRIGKECSGLKTADEENENIKRF